MKQHDDRPLTRLKPALLTLGGSVLLLAVLCVSVLLLQEAGVWSLSERGSILRIENDGAERILEIGHRPGEQLRLKVKKDAIFEVRVKGRLVGWLRPDDLRPGMEVAVSYRKTRNEPHQIVSLVVLKERR